MRIPAMAVFAAFCVFSTAAAQTKAGEDSASLSDTAALRDYMDRFLDSDMAELHVPGAVVAIVYKNRVVMLRGYGVANIESKTAIDPYRTIFRAGSVTKPLTAVAVMQQVEQGRLAPDTDVNRYLRDFKVPLRFGRPVTVSELLTHTAGFDVELAGTAARSEKEVRRLGEYLREHLPPLVRSPGSTIAYSNHGFALLGQIVEQLSGEAYPAYMKRHVFEPLGMTSSTIEFTPDVEARAATPYEPRGMTALRVAPPLHPNISPAASLNTTASDMSRFMIAMLNGGVIDGRRILADSTVREMMATHFVQDPRMPGMSWGFLESNWHNKRMVFHSGGIRGFMSAVYLWPQDSIGLFVSDNGYSGGLVFDALFHFMDRYMAATPMIPPRPSAANLARLRKYAGFYQDANHPMTTLEKAGGIRNPALEIRVTDSGTVTAFGVNFVEIAPRFFHELKGWETLAFLENRNGEVAGVVTTYPFPGTQVWNRISFLETGVPSQIVMIWTLLLAIGLLAKPPRLDSHATWARRETQIPASLIDWSYRTSHILRLLAAAQLAFLILMWMGSRVEGGMLYRVPWQMDAAGIVAVVGAVFLALLVARIGFGLLRSDWPRAKLAPLIGIALSSLLFLVVQYHWNLLGIHH